MSHFTSSRFTVSLPLIMVGLVLSLVEAKAGGSLVLDNASFYSEQLEPMVTVLAGGGSRMFNFKFNLGVRAAKAIGKLTPAEATSLAGLREYVCALSALRDEVKGKTDPEALRIDKAIEAIAIKVKAVKSTFDKLKGAGITSESARNTIEKRVRQQLIELGALSFDAKYGKGDTAGGAAKLEGFVDAGFAIIVKDWNHCVFEKTQVASIPLPGEGELSREVKVVKAVSAGKKSSAVIFAKEGLLGPEPAHPEVLGNDEKVVAPAKG